MKVSRVNQKLLKNILIGVVVVGFLYLIFFAKRTEGFAVVEKPYYAGNINTDTKVFIPASEFPENKYLKTIRFSTFNGTTWVPMENNPGLNTDNIGLYHKNIGPTIIFKTGSTTVVKCENNTVSSGSIRLPAATSNFKPNGLTISGLSSAAVAGVSEEKLTKSTTKATINATGPITTSPHDATLKIDLIFVDYSDIPSLVPDPSNPTKAYSDPRVSSNYQFAINPVTKKATKTVSNVPTVGGDVVKDCKPPSP